jgi:hypothetical protein
MSSFNPEMSGIGPLLREGELTGEPMTEKIERNRKNCSRMNNPPEPIYTYQWMTDRTEIEIEGQGVFRARKHPRFGYVINLPARFANTNFGPGNKSTINKHGDSIRGLQLIQVKEEPGTS